MTRCSDEDGDARGRQSHGHGYTADTIPSHPEAERGPRTQPLAAGPGGHGPLSSGTSGPAAALRPARGRRRARGSGHSLSGAKASPRHPEPPKHTKREEELGCAGGLRGGKSVSSPKHRLADSDPTGLPTELRCKREQQGTGDRARPRPRPTEGEARPLARSRLRVSSRPRPRRARPRRSLCHAGSADARGLAAFVGNCLVHGKQRQVGD